MVPALPALRLHAANDRPIRPDGSYVLYWMISHRRARWNFALDHAADRARELGKPLVVFEALRVAYPWASDRLHRWVIDGMAANERAFAATPVVYFPWVETYRGEGKGLLEALADHAALVVTDEAPGFFFPHMVATAAARLPARLEVVDGNGLLPLRAAPATFFRAVDLRRFLQRELPRHFGALPRENALADLPAAPAGLLAAVQTRWPATELATAATPAFLAGLPIDHAVPPVAARGGSEAAQERLETFLADRLPRYIEDRLNLDRRATSELSADLHFGHISAHEVYARVVARNGWHPGKVATKATGSKEGWWGLPPEAEAFLDQLVTWRELGYNFSFHRPDHAEYESLPAWCRTTLEKHAADPRPWCYTPAQLEAAATHDELWNAAQRELAVDGRIHNYLRMLWAKKILEWSPSPQEALAVMIDLNNKYGLDGRNPNSYSGIFWCLGRYDRPWAPERPIFGSIRYMSSDSTRKKMRVDGYIRRYLGLGF